MLFWTLTEQLPVYETCQEEEADGGGLEQSSALEQRGGEHVVTLSLWSLSGCMVSLI